MVDPEHPFDREAWMTANNVRSIEVRDSEWAVGWVAHGHDDVHAHFSLSHYEARSYQGDVLAFVFDLLARALSERRLAERARPDTTSKEGRDG